MYTTHPISIDIPTSVFQTIVLAAALYPPQIHNDFPAVFPKSPRLGQTVKIECLAYGRYEVT